jgi:predicted enzyme related to lactoylglutathione lyase
VIGQHLGVAEIFPHPLHRAFDRLDSTVGRIPADTASPCSHSRPPRQGVLGGASREAYRSTIDPAEPVPQSRRNSVRESLVAFSREQSTNSSAEEVVVLDGLGSVTIFVTDQDRAVDFYTKKLGLELRRDDSFGFIRWVEVAPAGAPTSIVLFPKDNPVYQEDLMREFTGLQFVTADIEATHAELSSRGVTFTQPPMQMPFGRTAVFIDDDKNQFALLEAPGAS